MVEAGALIVVRTESTKTFSTTELQSKVGRIYKEEYGSVEVQKVEKSIDA